ncbi:MAG: hypothetical protein WA865_07720 [Spirulinaceae cyanobacterium]
MDSQIEQLIAVLDQIASLLDSDGETGWHSQIVESKRRLLNSDYSGIEYLLGAYGGMGSFNDLVICQGLKDGKFAWKPGYIEKNNLLNELRTKAWEIATFIKRNNDISS